MTRTCTTWLALSLLVFVGWRPTPVRATIMIERSLEELADAADGIAVGRVERVGTQLEFTHPGFMPWTRVRIRVQEWWKAPSGVSSPSSINLRERGGTWPASNAGPPGGVSIEGTPNYRVGEDVVVFLRRDPNAPGTFRTLGMAQGKFSVRRGVPGTADAAVRDTSTLTYADLSAGSTQLRHATPTTLLPLTTLRATVQRALADNASGGAGGVR